MVLRQFKIPRHGGPDGQGLPQSVFQELLRIFQDNSVSDVDAQATMLLSFDTSTQAQWNQEYRPQLMHWCVDNDQK